MKRSYNSVYVSALLLISLYACEFSPSEIPMSEIEKPSNIAPDIWVELSPEMDTLRLSEPAWVTYSVETGNNKLHRINFQIDDEEIANLNYESAQKISAYLNTNLVEDGLHELKITTYTSTSSGSIADKIGAEQYWYEIKWPVFINKNAKQNFTLNELEFIPEGIKISWPEYNYVDFLRYEFTFYISNRDLLKEKNDITDPTQNFFITNSYVEGLFTRYSIYVFFTEGGFLYDNKSYYKEIDSPIVQINQDRSIDINWTHSKNEQNVKSYYIETSVPNYGMAEEHDITDLNDTTLRLQEKIGFGGNYQVQLSYIPNGYNSYYSALDPAGGLTNFALGDSIPKFQKAFHIPSENSLLIYNEGTFSKYDIARSEASSTIPASISNYIYNWTIVASPDGNYFGYVENQELFLYRSIDMTIVNKINIATYVGNNFFINDITISNNGLISILNSNNNLQIIEIATGDNIFEMQFENNLNIREAILSPDGQYLAVVFKDNNLNKIFLTYYSFDSNQLNELGRVEGVGNDIGAILAFSPQAEQKLVISRWHAIYEYTIEVRDLHTFDLIHSVEIPNSYVPIAYDFVFDKAIAQYQYHPSKKNSLLINLETGTINKIVQFTGKEPMVYAGEAVYAGNGRTIEPGDYIIE